MPRSAQYVMPAAYVIAPGETINETDPGGGGGGGDNDLTWHEQPSVFVPVLPVVRWSQQPLSPQLSKATHVGSELHSAWHASSDTKPPE